MSLKQNRAIRKFIPEGAKEMWRGKIAEVSGSTTVPDNPLFCWVRPEVGGQPLAIYNDSTPHEKGRRVSVGNDRVDKRVRVLHGIYTAGTTQTVNPNVGPHDHGPTSTNPGYFADWQILPLLVVATTGMTVHANSGMIVYQGKPFRVAATDIDLTSNIPGSGARYSLIRVSSVGVLSVQDGTPVNSYADLSDSDIPECTVGYAAIAYVRLYYGQTALSKLTTNPDVRMLVWGGGLFDAGGGGGINAESVETDTIDFDGVLSIADDNVQKALDTIDDHTHGSAGEVPNLHWVPGVYVSSFFDETDESLHILISNTGLIWTNAGISYGDTVRDPSLLFHGGKWWIAHTHNGSPMDLIPIISSDNLFAWSPVVELDTSEMGGSGVAWAPEWFVDDDDIVHLFMACGNVGSHKIYETHPTNAAWTTWSNLIEVTGTGFPADMIDACVRKIGDTYYLWYKDDNTDYLCYATSSSLTSGYIEKKDGDWAGFGDNREGPCLVQIDADTWRIYYNTTLTNGIYYSESSDGFANWTTPAAIASLYNLSHGTVLQVSNFAAYKSIIKALGDIGTVTQINAGTGMTGGPIIATGTLSLAATDVTPGSYSNANIVVDQQGRITNASSGGAPPSGQYRQFVYIIDLDVGDFSFVKTEDGSPVTALQNLE